MNNFSSLEVSEFVNLVNSGDYITIDIRTDREVQYYPEIPKTNFRYDFYNPNFASDILALDKNKKYLVYCGHGNRTKYLLDFMKQEGFLYAYDLDGGMNAYNK